MCSELLAERKASLRTGCARLVAAALESRDASEGGEMADYTMKRLEDVKDVLGDYPGEMRMMTGDLEAEQVAFSHRRMPQHTGGKGSYGHRHKEQGDLLRRLGKAALQARRRRRVGRRGNRGARSSRDVALGLERRAGGR